MEWLFYIGIFLIGTILGFIWHGIVAEFKLRKTQAFVASQLMNTTETQKQVLRNLPLKQITSENLIEFLECDDFIPTHKYEDIINLHVGEIGMNNNYRFIVK